MQIQVGLAYHAPRCAVSGAFSKMAVREQTHGQGGESEARQGQKQGQAARGRQDRLNRGIVALQSILHAENHHEAESGQPFLAKNEPQQKEKEDNVKGLQELIRQGGEQIANETRRTIQVDDGSIAGRWRWLAHPAGQHDSPNHPAAPTLRQELIPQGRPARPVDRGIGRQAGDSTK